MIAGLYYDTSMYLMGQARGQLYILTHTITFAEFAEKNELTERQVENLEQIEKIKKYAIDSLAYKATSNYNFIYNQQNAPSLWVITASEPYRLNAYYWNFPIVGKVSYKGFFDEKKAKAAFNHLRCLGYDVDLREVSAWSTLGWFSDPIMSNSLNRSKAEMCDLLFHELFHATYYKANAVNLNENLASFIAEKATIKYLQKDTFAIRKYLNDKKEREIINAFILNEANELRKYYDTISEKTDRNILKLKRIYQIAERLKNIQLGNQQLIQYHVKSMMEQKNAYFIDFEQYNSLQDSLEQVFNKFYKGNLKKLVQDLKQN
ncbi:MAG: aminopeptidase [Sphingobacteriaceae bacterium]|nr:aminopeptidase [Sphingobacteriaceae bacterium]